MANYSAPIGVVRGLGGVEGALESSLEKVGTQHALSTGVVEVDEGGGRGRSVTYYTASHFGRGDFEGEVGWGGFFLFIFLLWCGFWGG